MSAHTPGPWHVEWTRAPKTSLDGYNYHIRSESGVYICEGKNGYPNEADARLMAAAPHLLAACSDILEGLELRGLLDGWHHDQDIVNRLRAAIAGATGEQVPA